MKNLPGVKVDVARYATGNPIDPGTYTLDIFLNGRQIGRENVQVIREGAVPKRAFPMIWSKACHLRTQFLARDKLKICALVNSVWRWRRWLKRVMQLSILPICRWISQFRKFICCDLRAATLRQNSGIRVKQHLR